MRSGATLGAGGTLALAVLALLLLRAPAPPPGAAQADPASVAWADELLFPEEMSAFPADDESAMLPDECRANAVPLGDESATVADLARVLGALARDPARRQSEGQLNRHRVEQSFDARSMIATYRRLWRDARTG